jgi:tRNA(fMet)-specific endonuclease VapC
LSYHGIEKNNSQQRNQAALENFIAPLTIVDFSLDAAKKAATIRNALEKQGTPIGAYDIQIAAIALSLDMTLLTNNTREFERVQGLKLENWVNAV